MQYHILMKFLRLFPQLSRAFESGIAGKFPLCQLLTVQVPHIIFSDKICIHLSQTIISPLIAALLSHSALQTAFCSGVRCSHISGSLNSTQYRVFFEQYKAACAELTCKYVLSICAGWEVGWVCKQMLQQYFILYKSNFLYNRICLKMLGFNLLSNYSFPSLFSDWVHSPLELIVSVDYRKSLEKLCQIPTWMT